MQRFNRIVFFLAVLVFTGMFFISEMNLPARMVPNPDSVKSVSAGVSAAPPVKIPKTGIQKLIGKSEESIVRSFGKPERTDPTEFGYQWLVYGRNTENYIQIGIGQQSHRVETVYALGRKLDTAPFLIGQPAAHFLKKEAATVPLNEKGLMVNFELNADDLAARPLIRLKSGWAQLDIDRMTGRLQGVRYLNSAVLLLQRPYSLSYAGHLPSRPQISSKRQTAVDRGEEKEIFDITNILRARNHRETLTWDSRAAHAAYLHSREMKLRNYFSHDSKWSGDLKTRLEREGILFQYAGENIAARYTDAAAVTMGWLNSPDHRSNMLSPDFTQLGVGAFTNEYTQDFVSPMRP
ncbi:CAP domain-containing protein [Sporolactobacillus vineae]|uniref:CAP domain-containing protein n=1 Tax=Sporolactobacillus vineae TaxID=444463 RepID=UPI0002887A8C|nr:CAP domain-containing protein [Sporolactobacillus vineae]